LTQIVVIGGHEQPRSISPHDGLQVRAIHVEIQRLEPVHRLLLGNQAYKSLMKICALLKSPNNTTKESGSYLDEVDQIGTAEGNLKKILQNVSTAQFQMRTKGPCFPTKFMRPSNRVYLCISCDELFTRCSIRVLYVH
jgi:hypothetical protein